MRQQKPTASGAQVTVHLVEHVETGSAKVVMDHASFPRLRFMLGLSPDGVVMSVDVADRRTLSRPEIHDPYPPDDPRWGPFAHVTRRLLAEVPLGELERAARARVNEDRADFAAGKLDLGKDEAWLHDLGRVDTPRRGGRRSLPDQHYAEIAQLYVQLAEMDRHPVASLAKVEDPRLHLPAARDTVKGWVHEARTRGLLSESPPSEGPIGKAGGTLTERARQILRETTP